VFDLGGQLVGRFAPDANLLTEGSRAGVNQIHSSMFHWNGNDLESGVYLYVIRASGAGKVNEVRGKFAVVR
jgi:hypothetical protein